MELLRDGLPYALWAHDIGALNPDQNLYGSHPMLLIVHEGNALFPSEWIQTATLPGSCIHPCMLLASKTTAHAKHGPERRVFASAVLQIVILHGMRP